MQLGNHIILTRSVYFTFFLIPARGDISWAPDAKLAQLTLHTRFLSYHLIPSKRPVIIQKPSAQRPKAFYQHGIVERRKVT